MAASDQPETPPVDGGAPPATPAVKRQVGRPFQPGNRANPLGRPKTDRRARDLLRKGTPEAVRLVLRTMRDESAPLRLRLAAALEVLNRHLGKPSQQIGLGNPDGTPFGPGAATDNAIWAMVDRLRASPSAGAAEGQASASAAIASPGASDAAERPS